MNYKRHFTLVEILAAMGVLALLIVLMMQLFSTSQRLWIASDRSVSTNAEAGAALDLMCGLINSVQFSYGDATDGSKNTVFLINNDDNGQLSDKGVLIFVAKVDRSFKHNSNRNCFIAFQRGTSENDDKLYMTMVSDSGPIPEGGNKTIAEDNFYSLFPPYGMTSGTQANSRNDALSQLSDNVIPTLTPAAEESDYCQIIAENVVAFNIRAYQINSSGAVVEALGSNIDEPPCMLELQLTTMDKENYEKYRAISDEGARKDFRDQHKRTFSRSVFIGNRWALEKLAASGSGD